MRLIPKNHESVDLRGGGANIYIYIYTHIVIHFMLLFKSVFVFMIPNKSTYNISNIFPIPIQCNIRIIAVYVYIGIYRKQNRAPQQLMQQGLTVKHTRDLSTDQLYDSG